MYHCVRNFTKIILIFFLKFFVNFQMGFSDVDSDNKPVSFQQTCEAKRSIHLQELQQKEDEMRQMFVARVKEKEAELKEAEKEVTVLSINTSKSQITVYFICYF